MIGTAFLFLLVACFAVNMGGSSFAASFAAAYGSRAATKKQAQLLFVLFVILGAFFLGRPVATTLGSELIPSENLRFDTVLIMLAAATLSLFASNLLRVPQSTSLVTVFAIIGVGFYFRSINTAKIYYLLPFWFFLPLLGYGLTYLIGSLIYPPKKGNFWIYEKIINHRQRLRLFVLAAGCYNAFSVGANNVANAVGPLIGGGLLPSTVGALLLAAPVYGAGGFLFHQTLDSTAEKIVPIGLFSAALISFICGTLIIGASILGVPQSFVMVQVACIFAIGSLKDGQAETFANPITRNTYFAWAIAPVIAFFISYILTFVRFKFFL